MPNPQKHHSLQLIVRECLIAYCPNPHTGDRCSFSMCSTQCSSLWTAEPCQAGELGIGHHIWGSLWVHSFKREKRKKLTWNKSSLKINAWMPPLEVWNKIRSKASIHSGQQHCDPRCVDFEMYCCATKTSY